MTRSAKAHLLLAFAAVLLLSGSSANAAATSQPFRTGFLDDGLFEGSSAALGFQRASQAGATIERLRLDWSAVAPSKPTNPTDPNDPAYNWSYFDTEVANAAAAGQAPIADIIGTPSWGFSNGSTYPTTYPDPTQFADFAYAAAQRYDGVLHTRVQYWELFNEPNIGLSLLPQFVNGQPESAIWYRNLVNQTAPKLKLVQASNFVVIGSTAPFYDASSSTTAVNPHWGPLGFMRAVLCLKSDLTVDTSQTGCPVEFDAWSHHPYTEGGPHQKATLADDVELGDIPKMKQVLDAAWKEGQITSTSATEPQLWMTEFSWNENPPDSLGVPASLLQRWVPEAMYQMWSNGVTVLTWFQLVDAAVPYDSGFYSGTTTLASSQPKSAAVLEAFRFPFVAYRSAGGIRFWGRTPSGTASLPVDVEQSNGNGGWTVLGQVTSDQYGIFQGRFSTSSRQPVRALIDASSATDPGEAGTSFSLRLVPNRRYPSFGLQYYEPLPTYKPRPTIPSRWKP